VDDLGTVDLRAGQVDEDEVRLRGGEAVRDAGGTMIAQDEASSVVWGMPGAAAHAGVCAAVIPLDQIGPKIVRLFGGDKS
jgi:two-component system chemotaxis response regulator CheB